MIAAIWFAVTDEDGKVIAADTIEVSPSLAEDPRNEPEIIAGAMQMIDRYIRITRGLP